MSNAKQTRLQPMAIRVTPRQFAMLQELKNFDGISVQDHIRRALDNYLRRTSPAPLAPLAESVAELPHVLAQAPARGPRQSAPVLGPVGGDEAPLAESNPPRVMSRRQQVVYR